ncbi:hypothetical protein EXIGLDRAFT_758833 [Exidia glandulosa HHB12029]|uniref:F-box domain-containing protein n=1 Tax=Exidia glandulosa HHB12029 TaxID=1314781 RepID=A0A165QE99_EXIGL|nr:hypothetical protein EXIGLDRAFT_758833 [Exidia glandulosa HHB12029]
MTFPNDARLRLFLLGAATPYDEIRRYRPGIIPTSHPPPTLWFLDTILAFHKGNTGHPSRGRFQCVYDDSLTTFKSFTQYLTGVLEDAYVVDDPSSDGYMLTLTPSYRKSMFYNAFSIHRYCTLDTILLKLRRIINLVDQPAYRYPRFQRVDIAFVTDELIGRICSYLDFSSTVQVSLVCRRLSPIAQRRLHMSARIFMHMDRRFIYSCYHYDRGLVPGVAGVMRDARQRFITALQDFALRTRYIQSVRYISLENEWEDLTFTEYGRIMPPLAMRASCLLPIYPVINSTLENSSISHITLTAFGLPSEFLQRLAHHPTIRSVTLIRCHPPDYLRTLTLRDVPEMMAGHFSYLAIGFGQNHHVTWHVVSLCPNLQHLYLYAADDGVTVDYPTTAYHTMDVIHRLHTLHIENAEPRFDGLLRWILAAASTSETPGSIVRLKLHLDGSASCADTHRLMEALSIHHTNIQVLILDGVQCPSVAFVQDLGQRFPSLTCLCITKRHSEYSSLQSLTPWGERLYDYAGALRHMQNLQHFEANFAWNASTYSPVVLDRLLDVQTGHRDSPPTLSSQDTDRMEDGVSLVLPFASQCISLRSFAVRSEVTVFSCSITRCGPDAFTLTDVREGTHEYVSPWNPTLGTTWHFV